MSTDFVWDATRWRDSQQYHPDQSSEAGKSSSLTGANRRHQLEASGEHPGLEDVIEDRPTHKSPSSAENHGQPSTYHLQREERRHSPPSDGHYGPRKLTTLPDHDSAWQGLRQHHGDPKNLSYERRAEHSPLTLHIPRNYDLPSIATDRSSTLAESYSRNTANSGLQQTQSLPSFASLQEHVNRPNDIEEREMAFTTSQASCHLCSKLKPRFKEVAIAVAELDDIIQAACTKTVRRSRDYPVESSALTVQWILDRLRYAKEDVEATVRGVQSGMRDHQAVTSAPEMTSRTLSPTGSLKRSGDPTYGDDEPSSKRFRSGTLLEHSWTPKSTPVASYRRASIDFIARESSGHTAFSPPPSESFVDSGYPRTASPNRYGRNLPSPSSTAYPPSAAPSLPPPTFQSAASPSTSLQHPVTIHNASTDSATSAHIAELQHQVTLKTLAHQTLQSEYSSLLQKVQRLTVKTQTMERKSNVADQEVNELTAKNEDLVQQLQSVQEQLDESERKRGRERDDAAREKDQWLQMLDQSRQLQSKYEDDKRLLLSRRVDIVRAGNGALSEDRGRQSPGYRHQIATPPLQAIAKASPTMASSSTAASIPLENDPDEITSLKTKTEALRSALEEAKQQIILLEERAQDVVSRSDSIQQTIDHALAERPLAAKTQHRASKPTKENQSQTDLPSQHESGAFLKSSQPLHIDLPNAMPSLTTPEDVIKALGPVPSSSNKSRDEVYHSTATSTHDKSLYHHTHSRPKLQSSLAISTPWSASEPKGHPDSGSIPHLGTFRPLIHPSTNAEVATTSTATEKATSLQSPGSSPGSESDDSASTLTRIWSAQSADASAGAFGADLTPISTLPTPNSTTSTQQGTAGDSSGSYFHRTQHAAEKSRSSLAMPPPPRPSDQ